MKTQWGKHWYVSLCCLVLCPIAWSFPQIERVSLCLWTSAFICWLIFWIWNALIEIIFTVRDFPISEVALPSRNKMVVRAKVPASACQESGFGVNSYDEHVFQGGPLVHILCPVVSWCLWEGCQRARLCGGGKGRTEYDRQLLQRADHQELGGEHSSRS